MTTARETIRLTEAGDAGPQNDLIPQKWDTIVTCVTRARSKLVQAHMIAYAALL